MHHYSSRGRFVRKYTLKYRASVKLATVAVFGIVHDVTSRDVAIPARIVVVRTLVSFSRSFPAKVSVACD